MRRISMQYARPGIELGTDVFDSYGNILLEKGTRLTFDNVSILGQMGGGELFLEDRRVDDVPVTPLMPERIEGDGARKLKTFLTEAKKAAAYDPGISEIDTDPVEKIVFTMVGQLFPVVLGEANSTGCFSLKDYNFVHPVQVAGLSILIGRKLGMKEPELNDLGVAAILSNTGYAALPDDIMTEPGQLDPMSLFEVQQHSQYGYQLLKDFSKLPETVLKTILHHHEQWHGNGYPFGIKGESIPLHSRIITIADVYYALVSRRPYRKNYLPHEAIEFVLAFSGETFDPELVKLFTRLVPVYPTGVMVNLNTGEQGIVSNIHTGVTGRPIVRVCYDKRMKEVSSPYDIDLTESQHQHRLVSEVVDY